MTRDKDFLPVIFVVYEGREVGSEEQSRLYIVTLIGGRAGMWMKTKFLFDEKGLIYPFDAKTILFIY